MRKTAEVFMKLRDGEGNEIGNTSVTGYTDDEGATVVTPLGYLPGIDTAAAEDVKLTVYQPSTEYEAPTVASVVPDEENGVQTITFTL